jgi:hypothetical protein
MRPWYRGRAPKGRDIAEFYTLQPAIGIPFDFRLIENQCYVKVAPAGICLFSNRKENPAVSATCVFAHFLMIKLSQARTKPYRLTILCLNHERVNVAQRLPNGTSSDKAGLS